MTHDGSFGIWFHPDYDEDEIAYEWDGDACPLCSGLGRVKIADDAGDGLAYDVCPTCQGTGVDG